MIKKILESLTVSLIVIVVIGGYFKLGGTLPLEINQVTTQKDKTFDVSGEGKVVVVPDEAVVIIGVMKEAGDVKTAQDNANQIVNAFVDRVKALGISKDDVKTTNYYVSPKYSYEGQQQLIGYTVSESVEVTVKKNNFAVLEKIMSLAGELQMERISGLSFQLSDELRDQSMEEARKMAIDKAKVKAESMASLAEIKLGRIVNVYENQLTGIYSPKNYTTAMDVSLSGIGGGGGVEVSPGSSEVSLNVTLSYEIK